MVTVLQETFNLVEEQGQASQLSSPSAIRRIYHKVAGELEVLKIKAKVEERVTDALYPTVKDHLCQIPTHEYLW